MNITQSNRYFNFAPNVIHFSCECNKVQYHLNPIFAATENGTINIEETFAERYFNKLSTSQTTLVLAIHFAIFVFALFGNTVVAKILLTSKQLRTKTNVLVATLSVSDILLALFGVPLIAWNTISSMWPWGGLLCKIAPFVLVHSVRVSTYTIVVIAFDRYQAIVRPFTKYRFRSWSSVYIAIVGIWLFAALNAFRPLVYNDIETIIRNNKSENVCVILYRNSPWKRMIFMGSDLVFQYLIPMVMTAVLYQRIIHKLREREKWRKTSLEQCSSSDEMLDSDLKEKRRTVKLLIFIVLLFALSWLPYHTFYPIWEYILLPRNINFGGYDITVILALHSVAVTSICYNPFLYWGLNSTFKKEMLKILHLI